ncbi:oxidoreductase [Paenibacillus sp. MWE-103]|uniref:Oxidoreductase n=1 Tax=Paenibacillus artemisiicola TaxID=1172618 RepID=A0ABS3WL34_9BACL|nr:oxidoreductase [Paenibacillus artemisiicola]MBO7749041.1 oxidoreductase [Paenibacillus artemisiicola]
MKVKVNVSKRMVVTLMIMTLLVFIAVIFIYQVQLNKYKSTLADSYHLKLNHGFSGGNTQSIGNIDYVIKSLNENASKDHVLYTLGNLETSIKTAEESFILLDRDFNHYGASSDLMYNFYRDLFWYIRADLSDDILANKRKLDVESRESIVKELEVVKADLFFISKKFDESAMKDKKPKWIETEWREVMKEIIDQNQGFRLYQRMKVKYGFDHLS